MFFLTGRFELALDGRNFQVNGIFIQQTIQLADDLNLDELIAARLLYYGTQEAENLDRSPFQSALFLFHSRRKNILDCIRLLLEHATNDNMPEATRVLLGRSVETLLYCSGDGDSFVKRCIFAMNSIRGSVQQLREKEKHAETLRLESPPGFQDDLFLQLRFLRNQHEVLACIIFCLVKHNRASLSDFKALLFAVGSFDRYNIFAAHHLLPLFAFVNALCGSDSPLSFEDTIQLHKMLLQDYKEKPWLLRHVQAALLIWWLSEFNGLCNDPPVLDTPSLSTLEYSADIFLPAKNALQDGAFEFLLATSADISSGASDLNSAKEDLHRFLQPRIWPLEDVATMMRDFRFCLLSQFEIFVENFISNMADLLKEMKMREEEDVLLNQRAFDHELERFFLIIHYVYAGRRDAGLSFWNDMESNLFGFLQWASAKQTAFVEATFSYMLASLSFGQESAVRTHQFLLDEMTPGSTKNRRGGYLSWDHIFKQFQAYIFSLESTGDKSHKSAIPGSAYRTPQVPTHDLESLPEMSMILDGHMRLVAQLARESEEARCWLLRGSSKFRVLVALFDILKLPLSFGLWDSAFSTIAALLTEKSETDNNEVWGALDRWALGTPTSSVGTFQVGSTVSGFAHTNADKLNTILTTAHATDAFVQLLTSLVVLPKEYTLFKDCLPFPETLGSSYRASGVNPYIDFVLHNVLAATNLHNLPPRAPPFEKQETTEERFGRLQYKKFRPALQLSCLRFIRTTLIILNEDLFVLANKNLPVDAGIRSASLEVYAKLHPFGRVMEHLHTERCIKVIFEILKLGIEDLIGGTESDSLFVQTVLLAIDILSLAIRLEPTYSQIVRPLVRKEDSIKRTALGEHGYASLADAIMSHLESVVDICLYAGADQPEIALAAVDLLEKITITPKLVTASEHNFARQLPKNRMLGMVEQSAESRRIIFSFIQKWEEIPSAVGLDGLDPRLSFRLPILRLLENSLDMDPKEYNLAHLLLGYGCDEKGGISLSTAPGGIGSGVSLLHGILQTTQLSPELIQIPIYDETMCQLTNACFSLLKRLWRSPATSSETLFVLRANKFIFSRFLAESIIDPKTTWTSSTPELHTVGELISLCNLLQRRSSLFEYTALEIRQMAAQGASTLVSKYLSTLLGLTILPEGTERNVHILDLLDFLEFDMGGEISAPELRFFTMSNLSAFEDKSQGVLIIDLNQLSQNLILQKIQMSLPSASLEATDPVDLEMQNILMYLEFENQRRLCMATRLDCLRSWSILIMVMLEDCEWDSSTKAAFILQALQSILPKLEIFVSDDSESAQELSSLSHALISHLEFNILTFGNGRASDMANERLFRLFRLSLRCIQSPLATSRLREDFYNIALRFLTGISTFRSKEGDMTQHSLRAIRHSGDRLLSVICGDAYEGHGNCRVVALLLLDELVAMAAGEGSSVIMNALAGQNFLVLLMENIDSIGSDLRKANHKGFLLILGYYIKIY